MPYTELIITEYIEGSSNNKAIEIFNGTGSAINLASAGYSLQMYFNGNASAGLTINLTGTVAAGDVYVIAQASASAAILAQADQTNGSGWFNGDDAVALRKGTTIVDVIGQIGFDPGTEWGTGLVSTADNTLRRKASFCAGEPNGSDAFNPASEWDGFATDTFGGLGAHAASCSTTNQPVGITCGSALSVAQGEGATRVVTATDPDGIVTVLDLTPGITTRAGLPTAVAPGGTGLTTTALEPTLAPSPTVKPPRILAPAPTITPRSSMKRFSIWASPQWKVMKLP